MDPADINKFQAEGAKWAARTANAIRSESQREESVNAQ